jgi:zinc transport system substrate-binding protein
MVRTSCALALLIGAALATGCGSRAGERGDRAKVVVSIFPVHDLTRRIAGERVEVLLVLPPGRSEHGYDPTPQELARLDDAELGIAIGLDLDGWVETIMRSAGSDKIVRLGDHVPTIPIDVDPIGDAAPGDHAGHDHAGHAAGAPDPHIWLDPTRMLVAVDYLAAQLTAIDPAGKDVFARNAAALKARLVALDAAIAARAQAWTKRTIVTFHGSMAYYARRYGIRIAAVVEPLAGKEPTAAYLAEVLAAIERTGAVALFSEPQLDRGPGEMIAREAGIALGELDPVGGLPGRDSYEALLTWNTDQLERVLR